MGWPPGRRGTVSSLHSNWQRSIWGENSEVAVSFANSPGQRILWGEWGGAECGGGAALPGREYFIPDIV